MATASSSPRKKQKRIKNFQQSWLEIPEYSGWLKPVENDVTKAYCSACNNSFVCGKSEILKHSEGLKHKSNLRSVQTSKRIGELFRKDIDNPITIKVKTAEMKLSAFFAEHNIAFNVIEHLVPLLKNIFNDSQIAKSVTLGPDKCTKVVQNVLGKVCDKNLCEILQKTPFSILIDESTDISNEKMLCCLVRYYHPTRKSVHTELLDLIFLDARDCSAESLYAEFKGCLEAKQIPVKNIIGLACDNASVMIGVKNSFFSRLKKDVPNAVIFKCICHSAALIANHACSELPLAFEDLIKNAASYISDSPKRLAELKEFQNYFNVEGRKVLSPARTRWLVMQPCIVRFLENWAVLEHFFRLEIFESNRHRASTVYEGLSNKNIKAYFFFLKYILEYFNQFNALFQGRKVLVHLLPTESKKLLLKICKNFLKEEALNNINSDTFTQKENLLPIEHIYIGPECNQFVAAELDLSDSMEVKEYCLKFYKRAVQEITQRFPIDDPFFNELEFINPAIAINVSSRNFSKTLQHIPRIVEKCNLAELETEWRDLPVLIDSRTKEKFQKLSIEEFWAQIGELKTFDEKVMFPNLFELASFVLSLPHSNAEAERLFSVVSDLKTKRRNRLGEKSLKAICSIRTSFQAQNVTCVDFEITKEHFEAFNMK